MSTSKRVVLNVIMFAMGLFTLCSLSIPLIECIPLKISDTGFSLLATFRSDIVYAQALVDVCGTTSLFQLLFGLAAIIFAPAAFAIKRVKTLKILLWVFMSACLTMLLIYMAEGFVAVTVQSDVYGSAYYSAVSGDPLEYSYYDTHTLGFLNFVFGAFIFIIYSLCMYLIPDNTGKY